MDTKETGNSARQKYKNLKTEYRAANDNNERGRKTFNLFKEMDEVFGHRPASRPPVLLDTSATVVISEAGGEEVKDDEDISDYDEG